MHDSWPQRYDVQHLPVLTPLPAVRLTRLRSIADDRATQHAAQQVAWRPRFTGPAIPELARTILQRSAGGFNCSRIPVAEAMCRAGASSVTFTHPPVVGEGLRRLADLACHAEMTVVCDHYVQAEQISHACLAAHSQVQLLVNIDVGLDRLGVRPGPDLDYFLQGLETLSGVRLAGISIENCAIPGVGIGLLNDAALTKVVVACLRPLRSAGCHAPTLSLGCLGGFGGLGFSRVEARTEVSSTGDTPFAIIASVIARPTRHLAVIDAGAHDFGDDPRLASPSKADISIANVASDYAVLALQDEAQNLLIGDVVAIASPTRQLADARCMLIEDRGSWRIASHDARFGRLSEQLDR